MRSFHLFFCFCFFLGIFYRDFTYIGIPAPLPGGKLYITEIIIALFIIIGLLKLSILKRPRNWIILNPTVLKFYLFFSFASSIALFHSDWSNVGLSLREFASYYYSFFFFFPLFLLKQEKQKNFLLKIIIVATHLALLLILYRVAMGLGNINSTGELRYGNYETVGILVLICWLFTTPIEEWRIYEWFVFFSATIITVLFINHRSAIIALIISVSMINILNNQKRLIKLFQTLWIRCLLLVLVAIPVIYFYGDSFLSAFDRFLTIFSPTEEANSSWRLYTWKIIFSDMSFNDYLIGKGWGWQIPVFEFNDRMYGAKGEIRGFHNSFLFYFYHIGLIGLGSFFLFIFAVFYNAFKIMKQCHSREHQLDKRLKIHLLISANIGIMVFSLFNVVLEGPYMSFFFWTTLGMIYAYSIQFQQDKILTNEAV